MHGLPPGRRIIAFGTLYLLLGAARLLALGEWQVPEATIRFRLEITQRPSHQSAGYVAQLPDGGILKGANPATVVMTEDGKMLASYGLWQNPESGFSIVFADPGTPLRAVYVYLRGDRLPQLWKPESGLTPSALLSVWPGHDNLGAAQVLGRLGRVEASVHWENKAGIPRAPLSIGGDDSGRPRPAGFYMLAYLDAAEAGKYWVAPFIRDGQCEVNLDGTKLVPKAESKRWGGTAASMDLTRGLHRLEIFQTASGTGPYAWTDAQGGLMYLAWRGPKEQVKDADARVIKESEIARSGACNVVGLESRDDTPVAAGRANPALCYWFADEEPLLIYDLRAITQGEPAGTTWTWTFPEGGTLEGAHAQWIFPGFRESKVKLTAKNGGASSQCIISFFGYGTQQTSLEKPLHRAAYRDVLAGMLQAYPHQPDPVASWSSAYWNNLFRTVEGGEGFKVLNLLFTDHLDVAREKLSPAQLYAMQDLLLDDVQRENPRDAMQWVRKFQPPANDLARLADLQLRGAELQMYYLRERKQALAVCTALAAQNNDYGERAKIRLGDLAFLDGDLNKATSYYADVQNRARTERNAAPQPGGLVSTELVKGGPPRPATPAPANWRALPLALQNQPKPAAPGAPVHPAGALQEVSLSENVRTLTEGGYLLEAQQALDAWEREFPLSKISGDFIPRESALYLKMGDWKRAQPMLETYCREVDASSFLPEAASLLIACVKQSKEPPSTIRDVIEKVAGRLKYHPVAAELDRFLSTAR